MSTKDAYIKKIEAQIAELDAEIKMLQAKGKDLSADAEIKFNELLKHYNVNREELDSKLTNVRHSSESAWKDMSEGVNRALDELKAAYNKAATRFK